MHLSSIKMSRQVLGGWGEDHFYVFPHVLNGPKALCLWRHRRSNFLIFPSVGMEARCAGMREHGLSEAGADSAFAQGRGGGGG